MSTNDYDNTLNSHSYGKTVSVTDLQIGLLPDNIKLCYEEYIRDKNFLPVSKEDIQKLLELWFSKKKIHHGIENECEFTSESTDVGHETCDNIKRQRIDSTV